jgi:hypothetical protein
MFTAVLTLAVFLFYVSRGPEFCGGQGRPSVKAEPTPDGL